MDILKKWVLVCIIGGIMMVIGTASGLNLLPLIIELYDTYGVPYVSNFLGDRLTGILSFILIMILIVIAGGGISVIIGSILVLIHLHKFGKLLITLGSGMGIVGIILYIMWFITFAPSAALFFLGLVLDIYFVGIILTIVGRKKMKKKETDEFDESFSEPAIVSKEPEPRITDDSILCPSCDSRNPRIATFCRNCGTALSYDLEDYL